MPLTADQQTVAETFMVNARTAAWRLWQRVPESVSREDLVSIGYIAVCQAITRWPEYQRGRGCDPDDPEALKYLPGYINARIEGSLLDYLRGIDWCTRSERTVVKRLELAADILGPGSSFEAQAAHAGVSQAEARQALTAAEAKPVPLDVHVSADGSVVSDTLPDEAPAADIEGTAFVNGVLAQAAGVIAPWTR